MSGGGPQLFAFSLCVRKMRMFKINKFLQYRFNPSIFVLQNKPAVTTDINDIIWLFCTPVLYDLCEFFFFDLDEPPLQLVQEGEQMFTLKIFE